MRPSHRAAPSSSCRARRLRIETAAIQSYALKHPRFRAVTMHYGHILISHLMQSVVCHQFHSARQRYALWLLQTHDRAHRDTFRLTQEIVAQSLGVRRATVSDIARDIQQTGAVEYRRGVITVRDRAALMAQACECYDSMQEEYERLLNVPDARCLSVAAPSRGRSPSGPAPGASPDRTRRPGHSAG
jgi:hypothetical protein